MVSSGTSHKQNSGTGEPEEGIPIITAELTREVIASVTRVAGSRLKLI